MLISRGTLELLKKYTDDHDCLELLQFFGNYPSTRFNRLAIIHGMNNDNYFGIDKALKRLVDNNLVGRVTEKGTILYSLTGDKTIRDIVSNIAKLDLPQRQSLFNNKNLFNPQECDVDNLKNSYNTVSFTRQIFYKIHGPLLSMAAK